MPPLSVLDLSFVTSATSGAQALRNTLDLAKHADGLGYTRYWVAEHHNLPSIASASPDIMIGQIAAITKNMRIGSGGVMLPNHAPLMVAERFKTLEALFPGRIDLGLGRAPGTDQITSYALRRRQDIKEDDDFRAHFQPSHVLQKPHAMLATAVVCADTDQEADRLAATVDLNIVRRNKGEYLPLASPEEAAAYPYSPIDRDRAKANRARVFVGSPATVKQKLMPLIEATRADEVMITSAIFDHAARKRSYT